MFTINNLTNNSNIDILERKGSMQVLEYKKDLSVLPSQAETAYFAATMNCRKRQVLCNLAESNVTVQKGAMQWMLGDVNCQTGIKGASDFISKKLVGSVTGEAAVKPEYTGTGILVLEPTYRHILLEDLSDWGGAMVIDDGLFLASEQSVRHEVVARKNVSSAVLGGEGIWNLCLTGKGVVALESRVPRVELIEIVLDNDVIKIDGNMAIAWSKTLDFTVEKATKTFIGSAASGEGFVNVYRGTGRILMACVAKGFA